MQQAASGKPAPIARQTSARPAPKPKSDPASRLRAAGIDSDDAPPADIDAFRVAVARRINVLIGNHEKLWRTCKEPPAGARACLAPRIQCSNALPPPPDTDGRRLARTQAQLRRTLAAAQDVQDDGA